MEYITANGIEYAAKQVTTTTNQIAFTLEGKSISDIEAAFRQATELSVGAEDKTSYGTYANLSFESATVLANGDITVTMHLPSEDELRLSALESAVAEHDEAIAEIYGGGTL